MEASSSFPPEAWQIPVDYKVKKSLLGVGVGGGGDDLTVYDARGNLAFRVTGSRCRASGSASHRTKTLSDAAGHPCITVVYKHASQRFPEIRCSTKLTCSTNRFVAIGEWQGFSENSSNLKDFSFTVRKALSSESQTELNVLSMERKVDEKPIFRIRGNPFRRSCVIIRGDSIVAEANLFYKLNKIAYSRRKFQVTISRK